MWDVPAEEASTDERQGDKVVRKAVKYCQVLFI